MRAKMQAKSWREKVALRAARLMCEPSAIGYEQARREAIRILGCSKLSSQSLPTKKEIREKIHLLSRNQQTALRRCLFEDLLIAMRQLQELGPFVDAELLTAEITPETRYVIYIRGDAAEEMSEALPGAAGVSESPRYLGDLQPADGSDTTSLEFAGMFFLVVNVVEGADTFLSKPHLGIPELESEIEGLVSPCRQHGLDSTAPSADRFTHYVDLLRPLEAVMLSPTHHPEGDALYHSLQVFQCALEARGYDEEFLLAALLHDVGKAIDREDHVSAGLAALGNHISKRTATLIELHHDAHLYRDGTLGMRARRRLEANSDFEELLLLAECDRQGRECGVAVPKVEQAIEQIRNLSETFFS